MTTYSVRPSPGTNTLSSTREVRTWTLSHVGVQSVQYDNMEIIIAHLESTSVLIFNHLFADCRSSVVPPANWLCPASVMQLDLFQVFLPLSVS